MSGRPPDGAGGRPPDGAGGEPPDGAGGGRPRRPLPEQLRRAAGHLLVGLYPLAWRQRYGAEMHALIDDDPPGARGAASLVHGAAAAHLDPPRRLSATPAERMRLSVTAVFMCWMAISIAGAGFQKETEELPFGWAARAHPLLAIARDVIIAGAIVGVAAITVGGLPLLLHALNVAYRRRDRRLIALLALPGVAAAGFALVTVAAAAAVASSGGGPPAAGPVALALAWQAAGVVCVGACALAPRLVLARIEAPPWMLKLAAVASVPLAAAMVAITLAIAGYDVELYLRAPSLAAQSGVGPFPTTGVALALAAAAAAVSAALALLAAMRARRAAALSV